MASTERCISSWYSSPAVPPTANGAAVSQPPVRQTHTLMHVPDCAEQHQHCRACQRVSAWLSSQPHAEVDMQVATCHGKGGGANGDKRGCGDCQAALERAIVQHAHGMQRRCLLL